MVRYTGWSSQTRLAPTLQSISFPGRTYNRQESRFHTRPGTHHEGSRFKAVPIVLLSAAPNSHNPALTISIRRSNFGACFHLFTHRFLLYGTSAYLLDRLQSVLNSAARLILKIRKYDPISTVVRRDLHWLPIQARIKFKLNVITRNCLVGQAPAYLAELCHSINEIPTRRNLRSATQVQLLVPRYRKERSGRRGFSISSPQLWNLLPADIRHLYKEPQLFRKRLKTHYMQQSIFHHWGSMSPVRHLLLLLLLLLLLQSRDSLTLWQTAVADVTQFIQK